MKLFGDSKLGVSMASGDRAAQPAHPGLGRRAARRAAARSAATFANRRSEAYRASANLRRWKLDGGPRTVDLAWLPTVGDGACSNLGAGCANRDRLALMVGTSAAVRALWRAETVEIPWGAWCYRAGQRRFVLGGATNDGGSLLAWLRTLAAAARPGRPRTERGIARAGRPRTDLATALGRRAQSGLGDQCARKHRRLTAAHQPGRDLSRGPRRHRPLPGPARPRSSNKRCPRRVRSWQPAAHWYTLQPGYRSWPTHWSARSWSRARPKRRVGARRCSRSNRLARYPMAPKRSTRQSRERTSRSLPTADAIAPRPIARIGCTAN